MPLLGCPGRGRARLAAGILPLPLSPRHSQLQKGRHRATCGGIFPGNWDFLPILSGGQGTCTAAGGGRLPGFPLGSPRKSGLQVPLNSDLPVLTFQESSGVRLGVHPGSATSGSETLYNDLTFWNLSFSL